MTRDDTTILLIRHGHTAAIGRRLVGRTPGVHLTAEGRAQADWLAALLHSLPITLIVSSPLERAIETAEPLARARGLTTTADEGLIEVDFGEWTGLTFHDLARRPDWQAFNARRTAADVPGGERAPAVQARIVSTLERLGPRIRGTTIAAVSHADVIRAAVLHYAGAPLDMVHRIEISPASVTAVAFGAEGPRLRYVNHRPLDT